MPNQAPRAKIFFVFSYLTCALLGIPAYAQENYADEAIDPCEVHFETVTALSHQEAGAYLLWQTPVGGKNSAESFSTAYLQDDDHFNALGTRSEKEGDIALYYARYEMETGRVQKQISVEFPGLHKVVKVYKDENRPERALVFANIVDSKDKKKISIGFFDPKEGFSEKRRLQDKLSGLEVRSVLPALGGEGWVLSVSASKETVVGNKTNKTQNALLYFLDKNLNVTASRGYVLGHQNEILNLSVLKTDDDRPGYIATGYFKNNEEGARGWVMRIDEEGAVVWQEEFRRGDSAKFILGEQAGVNAVYVFGDVSAADTGLKGVWLMAMDMETGAPISHRFFYAENRVYDYHVRGLRVLNDGRVALLLHARVLDGAQEAGEKSGEIFLDGYGDDFARLMLIDPRGGLLYGASYFYEKGVDLHGMILGPKEEAVIYGGAWRPAITMRDERLKRYHELDPSVDEPLKEYGELYDLDEDLSQEAKKGFEMLKGQMSKDVKGGNETVGESANDKKESQFRNYDGWVLVGDEWDVYEDPCLKKD